MPKRQRVEVDLEKHSTPVVGSKAPGVGVQLPADIPIHLRCFRLMEDIQGASDAKPVKGLSGWTAMLDCFTFDVKLYVRVGRDGTLRVIAEDSEGRCKLMEWTKNEDS